MDDPRAFLPLSPAVFQILLALADRERHGYAIIQDVEARTKGSVRLSPGTLYSNLKRLLEKGLIREMDTRPDPAHDDERRRYYRLSRLGRAVAEAELGRLEQMVNQARSFGLDPARS